eukprot:534418-Amphidinium_carterae.1
MPFGPKSGCSQWRLQLKILSSDMLQPRICQHIQLVQFQKPPPGMALKCTHTHKQEELTRCGSMASLATSRSYSTPVCT